MAVKEQELQPASSAGTSRRSFLLKLGAALNVVAASFIGVPVIGFVFSSFRRRGPYQSWVSLGALESFPASQTRLATYRNPYTRPWDGATADIPCWVRRIEGEKFLIATGSTPHHPDNIDFDSPLVDDSDEFLRLNRVPAAVSTWVR